jgi:hypothetical protein
VTEGEEGRLTEIRERYGRPPVTDADGSLVQARQDIIFLLDLLSGRPANSSEALRGAEPAEPGAARRFCKAGPEGPAAPDPVDVRVGSTVVFSRDWTPTSGGRYLGPLDPGDIPPGQPYRDPLDRETIDAAGVPPAIFGLDPALGPDWTGFYCLGCRTEFATEVELMAHTHPPAPPAAP